MHATSGAAASVVGPVGNAGFPLFAWLEITGKCQLQCTHCYAESGPRGTHGQMTSADWQRVIKELADGGTQEVQFIGGEPTLHPDFGELVHFAVGQKLRVEVFSNLGRTITPELWEVFGLPGVRVATSCYSAQATEHEAITNGRGSHARTLKSIAQVVARGITLRVGLIDVVDGQQIEQARAQLEELGVPREQIGLDRLRGVGRGVREGKAGIDQLCGRCTSGVIAVSPEGQVWPCVFSRTMPVGSVFKASLKEILDSPTFAATTATLDAEFSKREAQAGCAPTCIPNCNPIAQRAMR